jgi:hypothetical protein
MSINNLLPYTFTGRDWFDLWFVTRKIELPTRSGYNRVYPIRYINSEHGKYKPRIDRCHITLEDRREFWVVFVQGEQLPMANSELWVLVWRLDDQRQRYWLPPEKTGLLNLDNN